MIRTPSCFNNSSKAVFPGIIGMDIFLHERLEFDRMIHTL
jgi:hypothetical protein